MAYTKQTWVKREKVASSKLNHIEQGLYDISNNGAINTANLWNYGSPVDNKGVASDGSLTNNSSYKTTDYIPVKEGDVVYGYGSRFACYDANKVFVSGTSFVLNSISAVTNPQMVNGMHFYVIPSGASYFRICANKTTTPDQFNCRIADGYTAAPDKQFKFCGYLSDLGKTRLRDCLDTGWYTCGSGYTSSITDLPGGYKGGVFLKVFRGTAAPSQTYIRQVLYADNGREQTRILYANGSTATDWYESSFTHQGYLNELGVTALLECRDSGWFSCGGAYTSSVTDLPTGFPNNSAIQLEVFRRTNASTQIYIRQILTASNGKQWFRILDNTGSVAADWTPLGNGITSTATAVIIGASIEAGTTHETASSGAVVNAAKAYLTVALQRNGVSVTNLSHGGMGFLNKASDQTVFKTLLDATDFSSYDSAYIVLGSNDWNGNKALGATTDAAGDTTVCAMLRYTIEKIYTSNPHIKLFIKLPDIHATHGDASTQWGYGANNSASTPYSLGDMANAYKTICAEYGVEVFGGLGTGIANVLNIQIVFPDNTHPSQKTMALMADDMTGRITFR